MILFIVQIFKTSILAKKLKGKKKSGTSRKLKEVIARVKNYNVMTDVTVVAEAP